MTGRPLKSDKATFWSGVQCSSNGGAAVPGGSAPVVDRTLRTTGRGETRCSTCSRLVWPSRLCVLMVCPPGAERIKNRPRARSGHGRESVCAVVQFPHKLTQSEAKNNHENAKDDRISSDPNDNRERAGSWAQKHQHAKGDGKQAADHKHPLDAD